ncbi:MAG: response regulator, partial [Pseudomonadales bacterium]|nr:response regulator [Pseudomonadales bacterium]
VYKRQIFRQLTFVAACLFCAIAQSQSVTILNGRPLPLTPYLMVIEDTSNSLTFEQITQLPFTPLEKSIPKLGKRSSTWWAKTTLILPENDNVWYVQISYPHIKSIHFYSPNEQGSYEEFHSGYETFTQEEQSNTQGFAFPLTRQPNNKQTVYFQIASDSPIITPISVLDADHLLSNERVQSYAHGSFYGIFTVMGLFNLFIFFSTKDKSYLFYVFYIASIFLFTLSSDGTLRKVLPFVNPANITYGCNMIMAMGPTIFGALFCQNFLHTRERQPIIHKIFWSIIILCLINILLILILQPYPFHSSVVILTLLVIGNAITAGIIALKQHLSIARYFLIAWVCLIIGSVIWLLTLMGVIPFNEYSSLSAHTGAAFETILLSMALGDRINQIRQENQKIEAEAKAQLEESNRLLAGSNHFKDEFLSVISHELRTPMNGVYGATELLEFTHLDDEQQEHIRTIKRSSNDMLGMVEDILTFTQSEAGTLFQQNEPIELHALLQQLSKNLDMRCAVRGIIYSTSIDPSIPHVISSDKSKLIIILSHLLDNAVKFTENGKVTLSITPHPSAKANSNNDDGTNTIGLCLTIADTGCGVPIEQQQSIFESFRQVDNSLTRRHGGLGIGLALCKRVIDILHGTLSFDSTPGIGTNVRVDLSVGVPENQETHTLQPTPTSTVTPGTRVLVVEDNYVNKLVISGILKKMDLAVFSCNNGQEAVDFANHNEVDLILMDCQMPVMDGYEATRLIRKTSGPMAQVPIIAVTANANPGDHLLCLEAGMNDYLKKPITHSLLAEKINKWF